MSSTPGLQRILARPVLTFLTAWLLVVVLYLPAWKAGFHQDFHGWLMMYTDNGFWDILNRKGAGIRSFYQLTQLQLFFWTWLFGTKALPWFLLMTALHALNGCLLLHFTRRLFQDFKLPQAENVSVWGTLLFLISPAMTETVVWKACYHYLIAMQIILWILIWIQKYLHQKENRYLLLSLGLFLLSTLTLEIWFAIPWMVLILGFGYRRAGLISPNRLQALLGNIFLPMVGMFTAYLLLYHARYGMWLAHGAYEVNVTGEASVPKLTGRIWSYETHLHLGARFFPFQVRQFIYRQLAEGAIGWILAIVLLAGFAVYAFIRFPKAGPTLRLAAMLGAWSLLMLAVVLHYVPEELFVANNDRYLYPTATFQCMLLMLLLSSAFSSKPVLRRILLSTVLLANLVMSVFLVYTWRQGAKIFWGIQYNFHWDKTPTVLLLNIPCNYNGVGIMNANPNEELREHLRIFYNREPAGNLLDVASYNMVNSFDGAHVIVVDSMNLHVKLNQWSTWWWYKGRGLTDYENDIYSVKLTDDGGYDLHLKQHPPGMVILYSQGMQWREVDMNRRDEQWGP